MLPPDGVKLIDVNPAIIHASQKTTNLYFCLCLLEYKFKVEYF